MEKEIENLIEELTKVRPKMLNEEALKLFNTIMAILDERDKFKKENEKLIYELQEKDDEIKFANRDIKVFETEFIPKSKIRMKIEPVIDSLEKNGFVGYADEIRDIIDELMEDK